MDFRQWDNSNNVRRTRCDETRTVIKKDAPIVIIFKEDVLSVFRKFSLFLFVIAITITELALVIGMFGTLDIE